jgi:hypothetical protein
VSKATLLGFPVAFECSFALRLDLSLRGGLTYRAGILLTDRKWKHGRSVNCVGGTGFATGEFYCKRF